MDRTLPSVVGVGGVQSVEDGERVGHGVAAAAQGGGHGETDGAMGQEEHEGAHEGEAAQDEGGAGDTNNDGYGDVLVGADSVAGGGDVGGDGRPDVVFGNSCESIDFYENGAVYLIAGPGW